MRDMYLGGKWYTCDGYNVVMLKVLLFRFVTYLLTKVSSSGGTAWLHCMIADVQLSWPFLLNTDLSETLHWWCWWWWWWWCWQWSFHLDAVPSHQAFCVDANVACVANQIAKSLSFWSTLHVVVGRHIFCNFVWETLLLISPSSSVFCYFWPALPQPMKFQRDFKPWDRKRHL